MLSLTSFVCILSNASYALNILNGPSCFTLLGTKGPASVVHQLLIPGILPKDRVAGHPYVTAELNIQLLPKGLLRQVGTGRLRHTLPLECKRMTFNYLLPPETLKVSQEYPT